MMKFLTLVSLFFTFPIFAEFNWNEVKLSEYLGYSNYANSSKLSKRQKFAIQYYAHLDETVYLDINAYLRGTKTEFNYYDYPHQVQTDVNDIKEAASILPLIPKGLVLYRGIGLDWRDNKCFEAGETIEDKAFLSTSLYKRDANYYAFERLARPGALITLTLMSDQKGILISENNEGEILLMPDRKIQVTESIQIDGRCYVNGVLL